MKDRKKSPRKRSTPTRRKSAPSQPSHRIGLKELRPMVDAPLDLLGIGDTEGQLLKINPAWEKVLGYRPDELVGTNYMDLVHPEDRAETQKVLENLEPDVEAPVFTNRLRCKDGTYRWMEWKSCRCGDLVYTSARDISGRKRTEDELRDSRRMLETVLDTIPASVFWKDRRSVYLGCNRAFVNATGSASAADIIGRDDSALVGPQQVEVYRADDREVMESGKAKYLYEVLHTDPDGTQRWLRTSKIPLRDSKGEVRGVLGTFEDITDQKTAEKALRESEERYHRITRTITDYIFHVNVEKGKAVQTFHGRRCLAVTGYTAEEIEADPGLWLRMVDPEDRPMVEDQARTILSGRDALAIEHRIWRKDGIRRWVRNTAVLHHDAEGKLLSYDGIIQDITERKEAEIHVRVQHDLALALNAASSMEEGLRLCLKTAMRVSGMERSGIYLANPKTGVLDLVVQQGNPPDVLAAVGHLDPNGPEAQWIMEGRPIYTESSSLPSRIDPVPQEYQGYSALIGLPIRHEKRIIGCLTLNSVIVETIPPTIRETLETTVAQIGNAVARLRTEEALRESEERYRQLFESVSDSIFLVENESGRILEANSATSMLYGYPHEELLTMKNTDLSAEPEKTRKVTQTTPLNPENIVTTPLRLHRKKDGTVIPVEITSRYFSRQGVPVHISAVRDITRRRKMEEDLRESRQMLETVLDTIPVRVFWKDRESKFLGCNQSFARDAGLASPAELIGRDDFQMVWAEQAELYRADDRMVIETGREKVGYEEPQTQADGKRIWLRTSKVPLRDPEGKISGVLGTYEDITEKKQAEEKIRALNAELEQRVSQRTAQLEAANKELEAFSYSVSHDLRAPLRAIDGFTRALDEDYGKILDAEGRRLCAVIRRNTRRMNELIDGLLALSRVGRTEMEFLSCDMEVLAHSVFQELTTTETRAPIDFHLGPLPSVTGDPILLRQVWTNLFSNAIKFSANRDRPRIDVECRRTPEEDIFSVRDNGVGFDMRHAKHLFGAFQRLHDASDFEGTGVGLPIVQRVIHRHGGQVWAESELDKGAVFYFTLPRKKTDMEDLSALE